MMGQALRTSSWPRLCQHLVALVAALWVSGCAWVPPKPTAEVPRLSPPQPALPAEAPPAVAAAASSPQDNLKAQDPPSIIEPAATVPPGPPAIARRLDLDPEATARRDLWERVKSGFAMSDLDSDLVRKWEAWYSSRPDYVERMTQRGGRYLFHIIEEVESRGMPSELALLPFIESAFNPQALSVARASGMWQFMPATGKDFELKQNVFRDDRRDVLASTRAALDYLQVLQKNFGDWQLALAAYNWGQGNVQRAIAKNQRAGLPSGYESLSMPDETRNYLPKLQAVKNIVMRPQSFGLSLPELHNHPFFLSVPIDRDIDVSLAARLAGLSLEDFQALNPQLNKPVILAAGTPRLLLPYDNANRFIREWADFRGPAASWTAWVTPKSMKPAEAAKLVGMPEAKLREVNRIPARMILKAGSTLLIPRAAHSTKDVTLEVAQNGILALAPEAVKKPAKKGAAKGKTPPKTKPTGKVRMAQDASRPAPR
ncbi:MAG: rane-bound lytic murein transglycosylase MltD [Pseudomonadota bacterium]|jgi:membrane-bound lytic murein transglycosylase D